MCEKEGTDILNGLIITKDGFEANAQVIIENQDEIEIIEAVPENAPSLFIYQYNVEEETEIDFLFQIENSEYAGVFMSFLHMRRLKLPLTEFRLLFSAEPKKD